MANEPGSGTPAHDEPAHDRLGLEVIEVDECWELLSDEPLGRLAVTISGAPHIIPINYATRDHEILFVSVAGTKLEAALQRPGLPATFEIDHFDVDARTGWSVIVRGHLHPVLDLVDHTSLDIAGRPIWLDGYRDRNWLRLVPDEVGGRRLTHER